MLESFEYSSVRVKPRKGILYSARKINVEGTGNIAEVLKAIDGKLIFFLRIMCLTGRGEDFGNRMIRPSLLSIIMGGQNFKERK